MTWFWPEVVQDLSLLDIISAAKASISRKNRKRQLSSALLFFSLLATPCAQVHGQVATAMGENIFYRFVLMQRFLQQSQGNRNTKSRTGSSILFPSEVLKSTKHFQDCLGGASTDSGACVHIWNNRDVARAERCERSWNGRKQACKCPFA